jgi:2-dehydropantoate 2-reductase
VLGGLCFICLNRISRSVVERFDYGHIVIGEYGRRAQTRTREIAEMFTKSGIKCRVVDDLALERWRKLVWNIPFNGLSILAGGIDTAAILADEDLLRATRALMEEVIAAANKCGHALPSEEAAEQIKRTEEMNAYKPSTLLDFEAGKRLEIDAIWGEPLRQASAVGAPTPRLELVHALLQSIDRHRRAGKIDNRI